MTGIAQAFNRLPAVVRGPLWMILGGLSLLFMAIVILGGVVTATLLNLFIMPALYLRFGSSPEPVPSS